MMKATYSLTGDTLPILPNPHDCKIKKFKLTDDAFCIVIDDIEHDAVKYAFPGAKKKIRIRFFNDSHDGPISVSYNKLKFTKNGYKATYMSDFVKKYRKNSDQFLYFFITYRQINIQTVYSDIQFEATRVEYEWE